MTPKPPAGDSEAPTEPGALRLILLRNVGLTTAAGMVHQLSAKDAALLAWLALDGPAQRSRVVACLWPDASARQAHANLRQRLFRLRRSLEADVVLQGATLALAPGVQSELSDPAQRWARDANDLQGDLLEGFDYDDAPSLADWVLGARARWRSLRRDLLTANATMHEQADRIAAALPYADRLAHDEPLLEHAQRLLMRLHYRRGDAAAALAVFSRLRDTLLRELGTAPSAETCQLHEAISQSRGLPIAGPPPPVTVLHPPRLVGRGRQWASVVDAWHRGLVVAVHGDPGIGKTRLLTDFVQAHGLRAPALARPGDVHVSYAVLVRVLRSLCDGPDQWVMGAAPWVRAELARLLPELGEAAAGPLVPLRLRQAVEQVLAALRPDCPTLSVVIDDLQFSDAASLELLQGLITPRARVRWLLAWRSAELPAAMQDWLATFRAEDLHRCALAPLDAPAVAELLTSLALPGLDVQAWGRRLHRHSGGSPLMLLETLRSVLRQPAALQALAQPGGALPLPSSLAALIGQRLALLDPAALRLARLAALAGPDFSLPLAAQVLQCHALDLSAPWQHLLDAQVMNDSAEGQAFAHDLVAEVLLQSVPAPVARHLHGDIARAGATLAMPPARLAAHWRAAGELRTAAQAFLAAGRDAAHAGRVADRVALLEQSAACAEAAGDPALCFDALRWLVVGVLVGGAPVDLSGVFRRMDTLAAGDFERGETARMQALLAQTRLDHEGVVQATDHALACFARCPGPGDALLASLFARSTRAVALARAGHLRAALRASTTTLATIRAQTDPPWNLLTNGLAEHANVLNACHRRGAALQAADEALQLCRQGLHLAEENAVLRVRAQILLLLGRADDARHSAAQAVALHERMGASRGVALQGQVVLGWACRDQGDYTAALHWLEDACAGLRQLGNAPLLADAEHQLSLVWLHLGRHDLAAQALSPVPATAPAGVQAARVLHQAWLAASTGAPLAPHAGALQTARLCPTLKPHERLMIDLLRWRSDTATATRPEQAAALTALARRAARRQLPSLQVLAMSHAAQAWRATDPGAARTLAEQVLAMLHTVRPLLSSPSEPAWRALSVLLQLGQPVASPLQRWQQWVLERAATQVPDAARDAFVHRNPAHRHLLAATADHHPLSNLADCSARPDLLS